MNNYLTRLIRSTPLTHKMVALTMLVGIAIMSIVDNFMAYYLEKELQVKLSEELHHEAIEELIYFDRYVMDHKGVIKVLVGQKAFHDYSTRQNWGKNAKITRYSDSPAWLPPPVDMEIFPSIRLALLFDGHSRLREIYQDGKTVVPEQLVSKAGELLKQSTGRSLLTDFDGSLFLLTSETLAAGKKGVQASLLLASPIDEQFLSRAMGPLYEHVIAILAQDRPLIQTSSQPMGFPAGQLLDLTRYRFQALDIQSFDLVSPEIHSKFATIINVQEMTSEAQEILNRSRRHRSAMAMTIIVACTGLMFWISRHIQRLSNDLVRFGNQALGASTAPEEDKDDGGDELIRLRNQFHRLTEEVIKSHAMIRQEASEQNKIIVNNASEAIITFDGSDRITSWNPAAEEIFGWQQDENLGRKLSDTLLGDNQDGREKLLTTGRQIEMKVRHRDGHEMPVEFLVSSFGENGKKCFIAFVRDISARRKRELEIKDAYHNQTIINEILQISLKPISLHEQLQHALGHILTMSRINLLAQGVIFLVEEGRGSLCIAAHQGLAEEKASRCSRVAFGECFCGRAAASGKIEFAACIDERHDITFNEMAPHGHYCVPILSGAKVLGVLALYVPHGHQRVKEEEDILLAIASILAGIIERESMQEQLVALVGQQKIMIKELDDEKKFSSSIIRSLSNGLMVLDLENKIIACNPIGTKILQVLAPRVYNLYLEDLVGVQAADQMTRIDAANPIKNDEIALALPGSGEIILSFTASYREDALGERVGIILSFADVTRLKQIQQEMEKMNRLSTIAEIASAVAHEVRNPLAGIKTMSQAIEENLSDDDHKKEYIRRIIKQVDRLNELLTEFFTYARPAKPKKEKIALAGVINEIKPLISAKLQKNRIELRERYQADLPAIRVDSNQIQQVFLNLMLNSIDAISYEGSIEIEAITLDEIRLAEYGMTYPGLKDETDYVAVTFKDDGPGMSDEVAAKAFEPFFTTKHSGSGLGLAIVYRILNENNALIYLDCAVESGTAFIIFFEA